MNFDALDYANNKRDAITDMKGQAARIGRLLHDLGGISAMGAF
ncbi:MAG: hypothetical protein ACKVP5_19525 [Aestuariivirga sp.]